MAVLRDASRLGIFRPDLMKSSRDLELRHHYRINQTTNKQKKETPIVLPVTVM